METIISSSGVSLVMTGMAYFPETEIVSTGVNSLVTGASVSGSNGAV